MDLPSDADLLMMDSLIVSIFILICNVRAIRIKDITLTGIRALIAHLEGLLPKDISV